MCASSVCVAKALNNEAKQRYNAAEQEWISGIMSRQLSQLLLLAQEIKLKLFIILVFQ